MIHKIKLKQHASLSRPRSFQFGKLKASSNGGEQGRRVAAALVEVESL